MWKAYNMSKIIQEDYGMQQLSVKPPEMIQLTPEFALWLDLNKTGSNDLPRRNTPSFRDQTRAVVQLVEIMDDSALFWGCTDKKMTLGWETMDAWLAGILKDPKQRMSALRFFTDSVEKMTPLLQDQLCLLSDFQIFVRNTGEMVHFDVDRCFQKEDLSLRLPNEDMIVEYQNRIDAFVKYVTTVLRNGRLPPMLPSENIEKSLYEPVMALVIQQQEDQLQEHPRYQVVPWKDDSRLGYITGSTELLQKAWTFAKEVLEDDYYSMKHHSLGPPQPISSETSVQLVDMLSSGITMTCQTTHVLIEQLTQWWGSESQEVRLRVLSNFEVSLTRLFVSLRYNPCLYRDFQVVILPDGDIRHTHIARCFNETTLEQVTIDLYEEETEKCYASMKHLEQTMEILLGAT